MRILVAGLDPVVLTGEPRHPTADELRDWPTPLAAVVLELPLQELGYVLPSWDEYVAFADTARARGVPLHLDGARLWEAQHASDSSGCRTGTGMRPSSPRGFDGSPSCG